MSEVHSDGLVHIVHVFLPYVGISLLRLWRIRWKQSFTWYCIVLVSFPLFVYQLFIYKIVIFSFFTSDLLLHDSSVYNFQ